MVEVDRRKLALTRHPVEVEWPAGDRWLAHTDLVRCDGWDEVKESVKWKMENAGRGAENHDSGEEIASSVGDRD